MDLALKEETNDLDISGGDLYIVENNDAVAQHVKQRVKTFLAEWFLDEQRGYPYFDLVFQKNPDFVAIDATMKQYILDSPGVVELVAFELTLDSPNRILSLSFQARSLDGIIEFSDTIGVI